MDFLRDIITAIKDQDTTIADDGEGAAEFTGFIDTGSFTLNAAISGSIFGGVPNNKVLALAGEEATGKTFYALGIVKNFLEQDPKNVVIYYDSEAAVTKGMMQERGIDVTRVAIAEPETIQKFQHHVLKTIEVYMKIDESKRHNMLMVLDSLGQLPSAKELADSTEGKDVRDMTRAGSIRAAFRTITLKLGRAKVPMIVTNHTYEAVGSYIPQKIMSGGGGLKYAASTIIFLSKSKERDKTNEIVGNVITTTMVKSRLSRENTKAKTLLTYKDGLDRYYGLVELGLQSGLFKKQGNKVLLPDGELAFESEIYKDAKSYFTNEILVELDKAAAAKYKYGNHGLAIADDEEGETLA